MPSVDDAAHWADRARELAKHRSDADRIEVRADVQVDRRHVRRNGRTRASGLQYMAGIGIRAIIDGLDAYAYTNECSDRSIRDAIERANALVEARRSRESTAYPSSKTKTADLTGSATNATYRPDVHGHPIHADHEHIDGLLTRAEAAASQHAADAVIQTALGYKHTHQVQTDDSGTWLEQRSLQSTLIAQVAIKDNGAFGDGARWVGGERGVDDFEDDGGPEALGHGAATEALEALQAKAVRGGRYRTLCDPHLTGLMAHESFGHLTEYDVVEPGWSVLRGRLGERLAADGVTIRDAADMRPVVGERGGIVIPFDQEGTPGGTTTLLEDGILTGYMHARQDASDTGTSATGNARALDVRHPPIVRMRNTYVEPGDLEHDEALEALGTGVYLVGGRGGSPRADGSFMFTARHGYWVEDGEIHHPVKMASIYGNVLDFLSRIEGRTKELEVSTTYFGGCGKWDQSFLHVGTGGPHTLVSEALIGGQST